MKKTRSVFQVDAFTTVPFRGNPAGVMLLDEEPEKTWMQNVAMEMNLSETAFVFRKGDVRQIRFYSPESEVDLCGHATLSASHIMYETGSAAKDEELVFSSNAGILKVKKNGDRIVLNFPVYELHRIEIPAVFEKLTGVKPAELYKCGHGWTLALLGSESEVRTMKPDFQSMKTSEFGDLIVTAKSDDPSYDFCVRCFAPALVINEDPVTGSAHCALTPFWNSKTGRATFVSHQVSKREGILHVELKGNRVEISGQAVTVLKGDLFV